MAMEAEKREADILRTLRSRYEMRGYTFISHPTGDLVPSFLGGYKPDALAISDKGSVVVEIKSARTTSVQKNLSRLAQLVAEQPNWKLEVYYGGDFTRPAYGRPDQDEVLQLVDEVRRLAGAGFERAAIVMGWAALEAIVRAMRYRNNEASAPMIPSAIAEWLVSEGHVDSATGRLLRQMIRARNAIVHGDQKVELHGQELLILVSTLESLAGHLRAVVDD